MRAHGGAIATAIPVPSKRPKSVSDALERFNDVQAKYSEAKSIVARTDDLLREARVEDQLRNAADFKAGREPTNLRAAEDKVEAEVGEAQSRLNALSIALDECGDAVADAITKEQSTWKAKADKAAADALAAYRESLAALKLSLADYCEAQSVADWLEPKPVVSVVTRKSHATVGWTGSHDLVSNSGDQAYHGPQKALVRVGPLMKLDDPADVTLLFPILAKVGVPEVKPTAKKVNHPAESRFNVGDRRTTVTSKAPIREKELAS